MGHKSFEQLAQSAYDAYCKAQLGNPLQRFESMPFKRWSELPEAERNDWVAVAKQLWSEFAAVH